MRSDDGTEGPEGARPHTPIPPPTGEGDRRRRWRGPDAGPVVVGPAYTPALHPLWLKGVCVVDKPKRRCRMKG